MPVSQEREKLANAVVFLRSSPRHYGRQLTGDHGNFAGRRICLCHRAQFVAGLNCVKIHPIRQSLIAREQRRRRPGTGTDLTPLRPHG